MQTRNNLIKSLADRCRVIYDIPPEAFENFNVKRGLRNADGTGVLAGISKVGAVVGYIIKEGEKASIDGQLYYRGYNINDLIQGYIDEERYGFEECCYTLLFGDLPTRQQLAEYTELYSEHCTLPDRFTEDVIMRAPGKNIMNKLASSVLALYTYDPNPDDLSLENVLNQSVRIISTLPSIASHAYAVKRHVFDKESLNLHYPDPTLGTAQNFLRTFRPDGSYTEEEARLLDLCLVLHAEHGGGNNSTFACRVLTSTDTDTYSAISAGIGSLKGPKHGGANLKVDEMFEAVKANVRDWKDKNEVSATLARILRKEIGDGSGLIYGMGHAVYTRSDPRAVILKKYAREMAEKNGYGDEFSLLESIEELSPRVFSDFKGKPTELCANVDLYSGMVYRMLGIPSDLYTALFAIARVAGFCAHRIEEILTGKRIIRPGYKTIIGENIKYIPLANR